MECNCMDQFVEREYLSDYWYCWYVVTTEMKR